MLSLHLACNYPEAYKTSSGIFKNITAVTSKDRTWNFDPNVVNLRITGNVTMEQIIGYDFYGTTFDFNVVASVAHRPFCIPTEYFERYVKIDDVTLSMKNPKLESNRISILSVGSSIDVYSKTIATLSRLYFSKIYSSVFSSFYSSLNPNDEVVLSDSIFSDYGNNANL